MGIALVDQWYRKRILYIMLFWPVVRSNIRKHIKVKYTVISYNHCGAIFIVMFMKKSE